MNTPIPTPSSPDYLPPTLRSARTDVRTVMDDPNAHLPEPEMTPIRAPGRRLVVKTVMAPESAKAIAGADTIIGMPAPVFPMPPESARAIAGADTVIGMMAPVMLPDTLPPSPPPKLSPRELAGMETIIKMKAPVLEMPTDPVRAAPDVDAILAQQAGIATLPPGTKASPTRAKVDSQVETLPPSTKVIVDDPSQVDTLKPDLKIAPAQPPKKKSRTGLVLIVAALVAGGIALAVTMKMKAAQPAASSIVEIKQAP